MNIENFLIDTDSYKSSHWLQYPAGTTYMFSYIESRSGGEYPETVFFGLQYYLKKYLTHTITEAEVEEAKDFFTAHGEPFNYDGWMYIARDLKGKIPVRIRSVPEGSVIPTNNILLSIESTDPKVFWVVSWLETSLLRSIWYPTTVATRSRFIKKIILDALNKSSDDPKSEIDFKLHDFGSRGVSSQESAMIGGAAHLINFKGSDTVVGVRCANKYYNSSMAGFSIPATEHSSITSWGKENEVDAYNNILDQFAKPGAIVACVSDSYNLWHACSQLWGEELRDKVIKSGATLVIRPDSGHPASVVLKTIKLLDEKFGHTLNTKGFKVLNHVRVIQGDGINEISIKEILDNLLSAGYSATNIAFGMGGGLLQILNRDSLKFAMKCSLIYKGTEAVEVYKDPITDKGKTSKSGRLDLINTYNQSLNKIEYSTIKLNPNISSHNLSAMDVVFEDGLITKESSFDDIRDLAK